MKTMPFIAATMIILSTFMGCSLSRPEAEPSVTVIKGAPQWPDAAPNTTTLVDHTVTAMASDKNRIVVGTLQGVYQVTALGVQPLDVFVEMDSPQNTGAVTAMAPHDDGVLIAAESGLFETEEHVLVYSPLSQLIATQDVIALSVSGSGDHRTVWVASSQGLLAVDSDAYNIVEIAQETNVPRAIASSTDTVLVSYGERSYVLNAANWTYEQLPSTIGTVSAIHRVGSSFYLASETGLIQRNSSGNYSHFTLNNAATGISVLALGGDEDHGLHILTPDGITKFYDNTFTGLAPLGNDSTLQFLATDQYGNPWIATGQTVTAYLVGESTSFEASVAPILDAHCNSCHTNGYSAPLHDYTDYETAKSLAESIIQRISTGQMPPQPATGLSETDYDLLVRWYATGMNP